MESWTEKMDTVVAELVNFFQALKSGDPFGYLILLALVLIGLALIIVAVAYQRIVINPHTPGNRPQRAARWARASPA